MNSDGFTVAVAVNDVDVLRKNLCLSPAIASGDKCEVIVGQDYPSASIAHNSAIDKAQYDTIIFVHQDVFLPETWFPEMEKCLAYLEQRQIKWGVLGCFGSRRLAEGGRGRVYTNGRGPHGNAITLPEPVETLDEIVLIIRKSSGLRFDPGLPHFHLYGTDICMSAKAAGLVNCVFQGFCIHNTNQLLTLPKEFYECYAYIKRKWRRYLPIYASCATISSFNRELFVRRVRERGENAIGIRRNGKCRVEDPRTLIDGKT